MAVQSPRGDQETGAPPPAPDDEQALRAMAVRQAERVRRFKQHVLAFLIGVPCLVLVWGLTEYFQDSSWPDRFADSGDDPGTWNPWIFWAVGVWAIVLAIDAFRTYGHRPPTEREIQRELERLRGGR